MEVVKIALPSLEKKLLGNFLSDFELLHRYKIEAQWFSDETIRQVIFTLLKSDKNFTDLSEVHGEVLSFYPKSTLSEEWLRSIRFEGVFVEDLKSSLKTLEKEYISDRAVEASLDFAEYENQKNKESLENWLRELSELDIEEDDGSIQSASLDLVDEMENGTEPGIRSFGKFDELIGNGLEGGNLYVVAARPGKGKSAYAVNLAIQAMQKQDDICIDFFTLEMTKKQVLKRFISRLTRINSYKFKNAKDALTNDEKRQVIESANWLNKTGLRIHDKRFKLSDIDRMIQQRVYENKDKPYVAIIDYLGLLDSEMPRAQRNLQIGHITRTMKKSSNNLDVPIILLSQLNRSVENREDKRPNLADLRESGDIEQDASVIGFLFNKDEDEDEYITLGIEKNREGMNGDLEYYFKKDEMLFQELNYGY